MDAAGFLNRLVNYERIAKYNYNLETYRKFLDHFGAPQDTLHNVIHIAGTKGKGSVATLLASCLHACGYHVGLFTSPHLCSVHERIRIDNRPITESELCCHLRQIAPFFAKPQQARTYFETLTTVAFLYFLKNRTDFIILETGLGGRLDSTNVAMPIVTVVTRIGYDHQDLLGETLPEIAHEKAGIIKNNVPLILAPQRTSAARVLLHTARIKKAPAIFCDALHSVRVRDVSFSGTQVLVHGNLGDFSLRMPLIGRHHAENLSLALGVLHTLRTAGFSVNTGKIIQGITKVKLRGRFDILSQQPRIIFDCAHNHDSYAALDATIRDTKTNNFTLVFGTSEHKDFRFCAHHIMPYAREVVLVQANHPRAMESSRLARWVRPYNRNITIATTMRNALAYVATHPRRDRTTIIAGSFYLWQPQWRVDNG